MGAAAPFSWHGMKGLCGSGGRGQVELGMSLAQACGGDLGATFPRLWALPAWGSRGKQRSVGVMVLNVLPKLHQGALKLQELRRERTARGRTGRFLWVPL